MAPDRLADDWFRLDDDETAPVRLVSDDETPEPHGDSVVGVEAADPGTDTVAAQDGPARGAQTSGGAGAVTSALAEVIGGDLRGRSLRGVDLRGADLAGRDLTGADLSDALLSNARLQRADLTKADLRGANLHGADLSGARLRGAELTGADLSEAVLFQADLEGAHLAEAGLRGLVLPDARLSDADLTRADLRETQLTATRLDGARMYGASLTGAEMYGADLSRADLGSADLSGADLSAANLRGADLRGADLLGTRLCRADLRGADLRYATIGGVWLLRQTGIAGRAAGAFRPADLRHADLRGAQLRGLTLAPETRLEGAALGRCPLCANESVIYDELLAVRTLSGPHVSYGACAAVYRQLAAALEACGCGRQATAFRLRELHCLRRDGVLRGLWPRRSRGPDVPALGRRLPAPATVLAWSAVAVVLFAFLHGWAGLCVSSAEAALLVGPGMGPIAPAGGVLQGFAAALYYSLVCFAGLGSPLMQPATWVGLGLAALEGTLGLSAAVLLIAGLARRCVV